MLTSVPASLEGNRRTWAQPQPDMLHPTREPAIQRCKMRLFKSDFGRFSAREAARRSRPPRPERNGQSSCRTSIRKEFSRRLAAGKSKAAFPPREIDLLRREIQFKSETLVRYVQNARTRKGRSSNSRQWLLFRRDCGRWDFGDRSPVDSSGCRTRKCRRAIRRGGKPSNMFPDRKAQLLEAAAFCLAPKLPTMILVALVSTRADPGPTSQLPAVSRSASSVRGP